MKNFFNKKIIAVFTLSLFVASFSQAELLVIDEVNNYLAGADRAEVTYTAIPTVVGKISSTNGSPVRVDVVIQDHYTPLEDNTTDREGPTRIELTFDGTVFVSEIGNEKIFNSVGNWTGTQDGIPFDFPGAINAWYTRGTFHSGTYMQIRLPATARNQEVVYHLSTDVEIVELEGDANRDCLVNGADFLLWQQNFPSFAFDPAGDVDGDNDVDGDDFVEIQRNFGRSCL